MKRGIALLGVAVSLAMVGLLVWRTDLKGTMSQVLRVGWISWIAGMIIYLSAFVPRGWRWKLMLPDAPQRPWAAVTRAVVIGYAANNLLPFRLGEVVRSVVAGRQFNISKVTCLGTIAAEKVLDGCCLLGFLALTLPFLSLRGEAETWFTPLAILVAVMFGACLLSCFAMAVWDRRIQELADRFCPVWMRRYVQTAMAAVAMFRVWKKTVVVAALTVVIWFIEGLCFVYFLDRLGVSAAWTRGFFCLTVVNISILVPSAPGYMGVFQAGGVAAFLAMGLDTSIGLALAVVTHSAQYLPTTILGVALLSAMGLKWKQITNDA